MAPGEGCDPPTSALHAALYLIELPRNELVVVAPEGFEPSTRERPWRQPSRLLATSVPGDITLDLRPPLGRYSVPGFHTRPSSGSWGGKDNVPSSHLSVRLPLSRPPRVAAGSQTMAAPARGRPENSAPSETVHNAVWASMSGSWNKW